MKYLGIDFGTIWTKAAIYDSNTKEVLLVNMEDGSNDKSDYELFGGKHACPTAIFYDKQNNIYLVGKEAVRSRNKDPENFYERFKPKLSYENTQWIPLVSDILGYVYNRALSDANATSFDKVILTVPSSTIKNDMRWDTMMKAVEIAQIPNVEIIKEPEAASYYFLSELLKNKTYTNGDNFLVYDFGGGTFDPALVEIYNNTLRVIGEWGIVRGKNIGGIYIDEKIRDDMVTQVSFFQEKVYDFLEKMPKDEYDRPILKINDKTWTNDYLEAKHYIDKLMQIPVEAKHHLSGENVKKYVISELSNYEYSLDIEDFNEMIDSLIDDTIQCCDDLLNNYGYQWKDLSKIFLVGGSSLIPLVLEKLKNKKIAQEAHFDICLQKTENHKLDFLQAVAIGASMYEALQPSAEERINFGINSLINNKDITESEYHFKKSTHQLSNYFLGLLEYEGIGRTKSYRKAFEFFNQSYTREAQFMIAFMYFKGEGVRKNDKKAKKTLLDVLQIKSEEIKQSTQWWENLGKKMIDALVLEKIKNKSQLLLDIIDNNASKQHIDEVYSSDFHENIYRV